MLQAVGCGGFGAVQSQQLASGSSGYRGLERLGAIDGDGYLGYRAW